MSDFNQCVFTGRLGQDPDMSYTQTGKAVARINLAVSGWNGKAETTTWVKCVLWESSAERAAKYLKKGSFICVTARYENREYTNKDGQRAWAHEFVVREFNFPFSQQVRSKEESEHYDHPDEPVDDGLTPATRGGF